MSRFIEKQIQFDTKDYFFCRDKELANYIVDQGVMPITVCFMAGRQSALFKQNEELSKVIKEFRDAKRNKAL